MIEDAQERRRFFRIYDKVSLNYRVVQSSEVDLEISKSKRHRQQLSELRNAAYAIDARLEVINMQLSQDNPLIGEALTLFHRKLSLHERMLGMDDDDDKVFNQAKEVNISASGLAFNAETPLSEGTFLKMEIITYPEHQYIPVFAQVVHCKQLDVESTSGYQISVNFKGISDEDEERIVNHIFKKQAQDIKQEKLALETSQNPALEDKVSVG